MALFDGKRNKGPNDLMEAINCGQRIGGFETASSKNEIISAAPLTLIYLKNLNRLKKIIHSAGINRLQ